MGTVQYFSYCYYETVFTGRHFNLIPTQADLHCTWTDYISLNSTILEKIIGKIQSTHITVLYDSYNYFFTVFKVTSFKVTQVFNLIPTQLDIHTVRLLIFISQNCTVFEKLIISKIHSHYGTV